MNILEEISNHINEANKLARENGFGNIFYNEQYLEIIISNILNHKYTEGQGSDAVDLDGFDVEYKTINLDNKSAGSFQFHWLSKNKIEKYEKCKNIYFCTRRGTEILEIYELKSEIILPFLINKAKEKGTYCENNKKKISAHKSFSLSKIKSLGGKLIYEK